MDTKNFNTFNIVLIILIVLGSAGAGVAYYGLKETPPALPQEDQIETPDFSSQAQQTPSSAITEIVWPSDQAVVGVESPTASGPAMSFSYPVSQLSGPAGNQVADAYLSAYQEIQKNKDSYKEVNFNATIYQYLPLRDFLAGLDIQINADVYNLLDQADYRAVFCCQDASTTNKGLFLKTKPLNTPEEFTRVTKQMGKSLPSWEPNMINDLKNIFFPGSEFKETPEFQKVPYRDKYGFMTLSLQYANIKDTAGANHYFGYVYWDEMLFISNNQDCLKKMTDAHSPEPGL